ncbi:MAG: tetratricopeptide repeat protein [Spirochaetales bacterium]|nr:tetratricopeptide repeat protein [Spirochaetales bacterium]
MSRTVRLCLALLVLSALGAGAQDRPSAPGLYEQGRAAQSRRELLRAVELYRAALRANPDYLQPMIGLGEVFFALEEYPEALDHVVRARRYDQGDLELYILEGRIRLGMGEVQEARRLFEAVLARESNNLEARYGLAELDIRLGYRREAEARYLETLKISPQSAKALLSLAVLSESEGELRGAQEYLDRALQHHTYDPQVHHAAGRFALEMGEAGMAEQYLRTAVALDGSLGEARRLLAQALLAQGRPEAAVRELQQLVETDREDPLVWYTLGVAYRESGSVPEAINSLARAVQVRPDDEIARFALENLAIDELPINDPVRQKYGRHHLERGRLFEERNLVSRALVEYRRSLLLDPESKESRLEYGQVYLTLGYPAKYRQELQVLKDAGHTDSVILDDMEIIDSQSWDQVSSRWGVSQYQLDDKRRVKVSVFHLRAESREMHPGAGSVAARVLSYLLRRYDALDLPQESREVEDFEQAFAAARESGSHYFVTVVVEESERSFTVRLGQHLTGTGKRVAADRVYRTGNDRVLEALDTLARRFAERLPVKGTLLERRFDQGIVDLGRLDGLENGDSLLIVKKGSIRLDHTAIAYSFDASDQVGEFTVTTVDENVAEGTVAKRDFFDLINPGDELLFPPAGGAEPPPPEAEGEEGLLRRLFRLIGL